MFLVIFFLYNNISRIEYCVMNFSWENVEILYFKCFQKGAQKSRNIIAKQKVQKIDKKAKGDCKEQNQVRWKVILIQYVGEIHNNQIRAQQMFYYPMLNNTEEQPMAWIFLHSIPHANLSESELTNNYCSQNYSSIGSWNQETKDPYSPIPRLGQSQTSIENDFKLKTKFDKFKKAKIRNEEQEFKPNSSDHKKSRRTPQNANRNVVPNIMHQVISFLQKRNKSQKLVEKLIKKFQISEVCSVKRFFFYQLLIKEKLNHYVNAQSLAILKQLQEPLCQVYSQEEQRHYNKISRLLVQYFLSREFDTIILTSKRVNSDKKLDHLLTKRKILQQISQMFNE